MQNFEIGGEVVVGPTTRAHRRQRLGQTCLQRCLCMSRRLYSNVITIVAITTTTTTIRRTVLRLASSSSASSAVSSAISSARRCAAMASASSPSCTSRVARTVRGRTGAHIAVNAAMHMRNTCRRRSSFSFSFLVSTMRRVTTHALSTMAYFFLLLHAQALD
jgi:hypothetical protein